MTISIVAVALVAFGGIIWYSAVESSRALREVEREGSVHFASFVQRSLSHFMEKNSREELQRVMEEAGRGEGLDVLSVVDDSERVAFSYRTDEVGKALTDGDVLGLVSRVRTGAPETTAEFRGLSYHVVALRSSEKCVRCHSPQGKYLGAIVIGHDTSEFDRQLREIGSRAVWLFVGAVVLVGLVLSLLIHMQVIFPLFRVVEGAKGLARGDLTQEIGYVSEDEIGQLADHLRAMEKQLRGSLGEIGEISQAVARTVEDLNVSSDTLVSVSAEQASGAAEQAAAVHEVTSTSQQIAATSSQISVNVESIRVMAEETYGACVRGREEVRRAVAGMETVNDKVRAIADATVDLGKKSQKIGGVAGLIDEISHEIHLLALNAAIEAAGAGEHGKRFSVVAAEVRRLAERTAEAAGQIKFLIDEILESTRETVMTTERGATIVIEGTSKVDLIGESLEGLLKRIEQTKESAKEMAVATQQQALAGEQLVVTISDINSVALQVSRAAEQVEKRALALKNTARTLAALSEKSSFQGKFKV
jgi:methyl-accepting chemotaxis protein